MASRIEAPSFLIPAGTAKATPVSMSLFALRGTVTNMQILVPPGPSGLVGFSIWHSSQQIIPFVTGQWIVANDEVIPWSLEGFSDQPGWVIKGYNLDVYDHVLYPRILIDDWQPAQSTVTTPTPIEAIG